MTPNNRPARGKVFSKNPQSEESIPLVVELVQEPVNLYPYEAKSKFISKAEHTFYLAAREVLGGDYVLCPKVPLSWAFSITDPQADFLVSERLEKKTIDFMVCSTMTMRVFFGIQLDEEIRLSDEQKKQDEFINHVFKAGGLRLVHITASEDYNPLDLKEIFNKAILEEENEVEDHPVKYAEGEEDLGFGFLPEIGVREVAKPPEPPPIPAEPAPITYEPVPLTCEPAPISPKPLPRPECCPNCGAPITIRKSIKGPNVGKDFYVCTRYPKCKTFIKAE